MTTELFIYLFTAFAMIVCTIVITGEWILKSLNEILEIQKDIKILLQNKNDNEN